MKASFCCLVLITLLIATGFGQSPKKIAITMDDLPVSSTDQSIAGWQQVTTSVLNAFKGYHVPAIGFVNEGKLSLDGKVVSERRALLDQWYQQGFELGNHTWSHIDYNSHTPAEFEADVVKGAIYIDKLYRGVPGRVRYFRHPFLHTGDTQEKKDALTAILKNHGYVEAPATVDNSDWIFARAYDIALERKDFAMQQQLKDEYVPYMMSKIRYFETQATDLFNHNIAQILLIHANTINAACLPKLFKALHDDGYTFVSLGEALQDPAYATEDNFVGRAGISWIHRWAITQKKPRTFFGNEPRVPDFIQKYAGLEE